MTTKKYYTYKDYLRKYDNNYFVFKQQDGTFEIDCLPRSSPNSICLYRLAETGNKNNLLLFTKMDSTSARGVNILIRKLDKSGLTFTINQVGDSEVSIIFPEVDIEKFEKLFKIHKRKTLSNEAREKLRHNVRKIRAKSLLRKGFQSQKNDFLGQSSIKPLPKKEKRGLEL